MTRRLLLLAILFISTVAHADPGYRVIINPENPTTSISRSTLSKVFLKSQTSWSNGNRIMPVDLRVTSRVRDALSRYVHGRSATVIKNWWNQQIFAGKGVPPPELATDAKVVAYVLANAGAIGYVAADAPIGDARTITVTE